MARRIATRLNGGRLGPWIAGGCLVAVWLFAWWCYTRNLDLLTAWNDFSPVGFVYQVFEPENFARNFPSGTEQLGISGFMGLYTGAYGWLGIRPEALQPLVIGLEILLLMLAVFALARTLDPEGGLVVPILVAALVVAGSARNMSVARFGHPAFIGQFYNVVDVLRILAVVFALRDRVVWAAVALAAAFVCHPTMGMMGAALVGAMIFAGSAGGFRREVGWGAGIFGLTATVWALARIDLAAIAGGGVPAAAWFDLTRLGNFHWYPFDYGLFTTRHEESFVGLLAFLILLLVALGRRTPLTPRDRQVVAGLAAMALLVVAGLAVSVLRPSPALVKLCLHRGSDLLILLGLVYVVGGLWREIEGGPAWRAAAAWLVLATPFLFSPGFPLALALALAAPACAAVLRGRPRHRSEVLAAGLALLSVGAIGAYAAAGLAGSWMSPAYTGWTALVEGDGWGRGALLLAVVVPLAARRRPRLGLTVVVAAVLLLAGHSVYEKRPMKRPGIAKLARDYAQVQRWAEASTPPGALFMPPPGYFYGWREFSHRSSFGNMREWLHNGWAYTSNGAAYREGLRRFEEMGVPLQAYLGYERPLDGSAALSQAVRERYHSFAEPWFESMADRYRIDYFILFRSLQERPLDLPVAFENETFVVVSPASPPRRAAGDRAGAEREEPR